MAERLITREALLSRLDDILAAIARGETMVLVEQPDADTPRRLAVLLSDAQYQQLAGQASATGKQVEATVGGVAGGIVAGAGTTLSSLTGDPKMARGARQLGRRVGRALAVGMEALGESKSKKTP